MNLKTYRAASMSEALAQVKRDLGSDAVILHTRCFKQGGMLGFGAKQVVEVTAGRGKDIGNAKQKQRPRGQITRPNTRSSPHIPSRRTNLPTETPLAQQNAGDLIRRTYAAAKAEMGAPSPATAAVMPAGNASPVAIAEAPSAVSIAAPANPSTSTRTTSAVDDSGQLAEEMRFVRDMMGKMMRRQNRRSVKEQMPESLFQEYLKLLRQDMSDELAEQLVNEVRGSLTDQDLEDEEKVREALRKNIARMIPVDTAAGELEPTADGRPRTIALIGPTGVGKTTTVAKLAATFKLKHKKNVALITIDTYRIAAVEQLRTYANIIKVPLHVVMTPQEMESAIRKSIGVDVIIIDTAGRSQRDDPRLDQLADFVRAANPHETHLVLSSTASQKVMMEIVRKFNRIRADRIIFTKLDEAVSFGVLVNVVRKAKKQLSFVTTGQEVPHQIEPGKSDRLASLVLGDQSI